VLLTKPYVIAQPCFEIQLILMIWRCHLIHCVEWTVRARREAQHSWWHMPQTVVMSPGRWLCFCAIVTVPGLGTSRIYTLCVCTQLLEAFLEGPMSRVWVALWAGYGWLPSAEKSSGPGVPFRMGGWLQRQTATLALLPPQLWNNKIDFCSFFRLLISSFASDTRGDTSCSARQED